MTFNSKLTILEQFFLDKYEQAIGTMSSAEALEIAVAADETVNMLSPGDPAMERFIVEVNTLFAYAVLLEKVGR